MLSAPVLLIVFNRIETTKQVFGKIREAQPYKLFVAADGPRAGRESDEEKCEEVRKFVLGSVDWSCEVRTLFRERNLGCKYAVSGAIKWFFENVESGIVLEDDCLPSASFFPYCEKLLDAYQDDPRIGMISGHNYFGKTSERNDYSIITTCGVWGWAAWRRSIEGYDADYSVLLDRKVESIETICFRRKAAEEILKNSLKAVRNDINTWDFQFCEHLIVNGMYTIMPSRNLIRNLGFERDSTHTVRAPKWYRDFGYEYDHELEIPPTFRPDKRISRRIEHFHMVRHKSAFKRQFRRLKTSFRLMAKWRQLLVDFYLTVIRHLDSSSGFKLRNRYYRKRLRHLGKHVRIDTGVFIYGAEHVSIGDNTHIDKNCIIIGAPRDLDLSKRILKRREIAFEGLQAGEVTIGGDCHISQNCMIYGYGGIHIGNNCVMSAGSKVYSLTSMPSNPYDPTEVISIVPYEGRSPTLIGKVVLHDNVWIGLNSVVSPGVEIGENSFVRSNSFVMNSFERNSHVGGDPAVRLRDRFVNKG